jgi:2-haloacid dehalogenase
MMLLERRSFLTAAAAALATYPALGGSAISARAAVNWSQIRAVAFDAFAIFDARPIFRACEQAFPGHGAELANLWRTRQFEYQWLSVLGGHYQDFWQATRGALVFAARSLQLELSAAQADSLMSGYLSLPAWPDVAAALSPLRHTGRRLALLSNVTPGILESGIAHAALTGLFDQIISTDAIHSFKPAPAAYQLGVERLKLPKEQILFVAFAGWDAAGAKWFGYPTFWNNRQDAPIEELNSTPDAIGESLLDLAQLLS